MTNNNITIQERTKLFAFRSIEAYSRMINNKNFNYPAVVLAKQFLRFYTSIGANCKEAISVQSKKDYINKYEIALKKARETEYWIEIFIQSKIIPKRLFSSLLQEIDEILEF
ncbi:MAG: four helix bundle protein [Xenococcaceae cyanobacterium]